MIHSEIPFQDCFTVKQQTQHLDHLVILQIKHLVIINQVRITINNINSAGCYY